MGWEAWGLGRGALPGSIHAHPVEPMWTAGLACGEKGPGRASPRARPGLGASESFGLGSWGEQTDSVERKPSGVGVAPSRLLEEARNRPGPSAPLGLEKLQ